jgi:hypothetical protein
LEDYEQSFGRLEQFVYIGVRKSSVSGSAVDSAALHRTKLWYHGDGIASPLDISQNGRD